MLEKIVLLLGIVLCAQSTTIISDSSLQVPIHRAAVEPHHLATQIEARLSPSSSMQLEPPPKENGESTLVSVYLVIPKMPKIDESSQKITFEMLIELEWEDDRVINLTKREGSAASKLTVVSPSLYDKIWTPDVYIDIHGRNVLIPPLLPHRVENMQVLLGFVIYNARVHPTVDCEMNFSWFPADSQKCVMELTTKIIDPALQVNWSMLEIRYWGDRHIRSTDPNYLINFEFEVSYSSPNKSEFVNTTMTFYIQRKFGNFRLQTYLPSGLLVILAWLSLFMPIEGVSERLSFCTTTLLAIVTLFGSLRTHSPTVSYIMALDVWVFTCVFIVFLILTESIAVLNLAKGCYIKKEWISRGKHHTRQRKDSLKLFKRNMCRGGKYTSRANLTRRDSTNDAKTYYKFAKRIDRTARIVILATFTIFTVSYVMMVFVSVKRYPNAKHV